MKLSILVALASLYSSPALADCKPQAYGKGTGFNQAAAELAARSAWTANVTSWYGIAYASWSKSQEKSSSTNRIKFEKWESTFYSKPCK